MIPGAACFLDDFGQGLVDEVAVGKRDLGVLLFPQFLVDRFVEAGHGDVQYHFADRTFLICHRRFNQVFKEHPFGFLLRQLAGVQRPT